MKRALRGLVSDADVVNTHSPFVYPTYAAARMALRLGKPLFYHQHGNYIPSHLHRRRLKKELYIALFERPVMKRAAGVIALGEVERAAFHDIVPDTPCEIVPNGVDVPPSDPESLQRVTRRWGIPPDALVILYLARLESWKGSNELLETFTRIQSRHANAVLVLAGVDQLGVSGSWRTVATREGYGDRLLFTGSLSGREKEDMLQRADLFCLPSRGEGLSMSMLEAMAHGTAVMLSPECNFPEAERSAAGVVVPRNADAMADALDELLREPERLRAMGARGRALMLRDYSWEVVAGRLAGVYARALRDCQNARRVHVAIICVPRLAAIAPPTRSVTTAGRSCFKCFL